MKKLKIPHAPVLVFLIPALFFTSCTTELLDSPSLPKNDLLYDAGGTQAATPNSVVVAPSGDLSGVTDANAIENALHLPGIKMVSLAAGMFYINRVVQAPAGFDGELKGSGQNRTSVVGVGDADAPFQTASLHIPLEADPFPASAFFYFPDPSGALTVSNFSMSVPDGFMAETGFEGTQNLSAFLAVKLGTDVPDVTLRSLSMTGTDALAGSPDWYLNQPLFGAYVLGDRDPADFPQPSNAGGKISFQDSQISRTALQALVLEGFKDADLTVSKNLFTHTKQINIRFLAGCKVKVQGNVLNTASWGSIVVTQEHALGFGPIAGDPTEVEVRNNFITSNGFVGIEIGGIPFPDAAPFHILISGNTVVKGAAPAGGVSNLAGIAIFEGHEAAVVKQNTLSGEADFGVLFFDVDGSAVALNSTTGFSPLIADYGLTGPSDNNQVSAIHPCTAVDEGTGNVFFGPVTIL